MVRDEVGRNSFKTPDFSRLSSRLSTHPSPWPLPLLFLVSSSSPSPPFPENKPSPDQDRLTPSSHRFRSPLSKVNEEEYSRAKSCGWGWRKEDFFSWLIRLSFFQSSRQTRGLETLLLPLTPSFSWKQNRFAGFLRFCSLNSKALLVFSSPSSDVQKEGRGSWRTECFFPVFPRKRNPLPYLNLLLKNGRVVCLLRDPHLTSSN